MTINPEIFSPAAGGLFTKKHIRFLHLLGAGPCVRASSASQTKLNSTPKNSRKAFHSSSSTKNAFFFILVWNVWETTSRLHTTGEVLRRAAPRTADDGT
jgi:hypothetical protein